MEQYPEKNRTLKTPFLWVIFLLYVLISTYTIANHEMWGDEFHSWNIAKASNTLSEVIHNSRYEGHPPVWYSILWTISRSTHHLGYVQLVHIIIACTSVFLLLFFSNLPVSLRVLIPFGYFFLFEYAILSRNYAVGILLAISICVVLSKNFRYKALVYYPLLFLLTNTHLLALLLAGSIHLYYLLLIYEQKKKLKSVYIHAFLGLLVALPACYFIFPPSDSQLNSQFWIDRWSIHHLFSFVQAPLRSFMPIPAWWKISFWNTQFLMELKDSSIIIFIISVLSSFVVVLLAFFVLKNNRKSLLLFFANFLLSFIVAVLVFPMTSTRYAGFIYIGFIVSFWLFCNETNVTRRNKFLIGFLLFVQLIGGVFSAIKDVRHPFSHAHQVKEILNQVPKGEKVVTDYWALNAVAAFIDKKMYCIDLGKEIFYLQWNSELGEICKKPYRYSDGVQKLFKDEGLKKVYMISTGSPSMLRNIDKQLYKSYKVELLEKREEAIEKGGGVYLYYIKQK